MFILALDCSTSRGSVALSGQPPEAVVWRADFAAGRGCGGQMFTVLQEALREVREAGGRLEGIVVGLGPGSYSGVRQAIAAATGLAAATGAWLRGAPSVLALAPGPDPFHAVGDARRGTFYYTAVEDGVCRDGPELLADAAELSARLAARPAWPVYVMEAALPGGLLSDAEVRLPSADLLLSSVPPSARQPPPLEPIYLRPVNITLPKAVQNREP